MKKFWIMLAFLVCAIDARATTGDQLYRTCVSTGTATYDAGWCVGYLNGFIETELAAAVIDKRPPRFCIPSNLTMIHVREAVMKYITQNPEKKLLNADQILGLAIPQAYSCG